MLALAGIAFFSPIMLIIAIAIMLDDGYPVLYKQDRIGKGGKIFKLWKFRSMFANAEKTTGPVLAQTGDCRITRVGKILRATAMDELLQLFNILMGNMSFVGPRAERPIFVKQFKREIPSYDLRHLIRPGLTGLAQVYGRYNTKARNKLRLDLLMVNNQSLLLAIRLILLSFAITFRGKWTSSEMKR